MQHSQQLPLWGITPELQALKARYLLSLPPSPPMRLPQTWTPAAVLLPIMQAKSDIPRIILTRRSLHLRHHPGQICFPGGRVDPHDASLRAAAIRETEEEIGIPQQNIHVLGSLNTEPVLSRFLIHPFLGLVAPDTHFTLETNEVAEVFFIPLYYALEPANYYRMPSGYKTHPYIYFLPWKDKLIWGATAAILYHFAQQMHPVGVLL